LREEVQKVKQSPYETIANFTRRFRDAAEAAYPVDNRNADQNRILLEAYGRGLLSEEIAMEVLQRGQPTTIEAAMELALSSERGMNEFQRIRRGERGMEISAVATKISAPGQKPADAPEPDLVSAVERLRKTNDRLGTRVAKLEIQLAQRPPLAQRASRPDNNNRIQRPPWNADSRPRCRKCGRVGHLTRDCWHQQGKSSHTPTNHRNASPSGN